MRRESDCAEEKAPAKRDGGAECAMRARKRKADVATFLQDPDEEIAKVEMTRKKQYENQYVIVIMNVVRQVRGYQMLYSNGRGRLSTLADEECKTLQLIQVALESLQEMRTVLV